MAKIELRQEDFDFLKDLQHELNTQTNDGNAQPVYWGVMETREEPAPEGCGDSRIYMGDGEVMTLKEAVEYVDEYMPGESEETQEAWKDTDKDDFEEVIMFMQDRMSWKECREVCVEERSSISRDTGAFLTKRACQEYIRRYGYNHSRPHTYAMTAYRNCELARLLKILKTMEIKED